MNLSELPSVLEIFGPCSKTNIIFCLEASKEHSSIWIEEYGSPMIKIAHSREINLSKIICCRIDELERLSVLLEENQLEKEVKKHRVKLIVVTCLSEYYNTHAFSSVTLQMLYLFKRFYIEYKVKSVIITEESRYKGADATCSFMHSLRWIYSIPAVFYIYKAEGSPEEVNIVIKKPRYDPEVKITVNLKKMAITCPAQ